MGCIISATITQLCCWSAKAAETIQTWMNALCSNKNLFTKSTVAWVWTMGWQCANPSSFLAGIDKNLPDQYYFLAPEVIFLPLMKPHIEQKLQLEPTHLTEILKTHCHSSKFICVLHRPHMRNQWDTVGLSSLHVLSSVSVRGTHLHSLFRRAVLLFFPCYFSI